MSIGTNIKRIRESRGMQQTDLSDRVNVSQTMICLIERERKTPSVALLADIAEALGCTMDDIVNGDA